MGPTKREKLALWIGVISTVLPGLISAGLFPDFNVLPTWGWIAIATIGSMIAGLIGADRKGLGALTGGMTGLGVLIGITGYLWLRTAIFPTENFLRLEIAIGALLGAAPGLFAFFRFAKSDRSLSQPSQVRSTNS